MFCREAVASIPGGVYLERGLAIYRALLLSVVMNFIFIRAVYRCNAGNKQYNVAQRIIRLNVMHCGALLRNY